MLYRDCPGSASRRWRAGFTLVELLVALFLFALIAGVIFAAFAAVVQGVEKGQQSADVYRVGRVALQRLAQEIGATVHSPSSTGTPSLYGTKGSGSGDKANDCITFTVVPAQRFVDQGPRNDLCEVS